MTRTARVRFTTGPLGLVRADSPYHFVDEVVDVGDEGAMCVEGDLPLDVPEGYVLVKAEVTAADGAALYAPVHPSMVEAV